METCCGYGYGPARDSHRLARIFKGRQRRSGHRKSRGALRRQRPYLRASRFQGVRALLRKENSHRGLCRRLRGRLRCRTGPASGTLSVLGFGNIDPIPFRWEQGVFIKCVRQRPTPPFRTEFPYRLGPTDPCSTAVHMEPFSTSVFKVLI